MTATTLTVPPDALRTGRYNHVVHDYIPLYWRQK